MKKILILFFFLIGGITYGQNTFKYEVRATGGLSIGSNQSKIDSAVINNSTKTITFYNGSDSLIVGLTLSDIVDIGEYGISLSDTIPLFFFDVGNGLTSGINAFEDGMIIWSFYNSSPYTYHITSLMGILAAGNGSETISAQISWHATFKSGSATNLNTSPFVINSLSTGTEDTSFNNNDIPPGVFVWCTLSGVSTNNEPSYLGVTITGYRTIN